MADFSCRNLTFRANATSRAKPVGQALQEKYREDEDFSRKGATAFLRVFFASLRLCVRNTFFPQSPRGDLSTFRAKQVGRLVAPHQTKKQLTAAQI